MSYLGKRVIALRREKGWDQQRLADELRRANPGLRTSKSTISAIETGRAATTGILVDLAQVFGVTADWLQTGQGPRLPDMEMRKLKDPRTILESVFSAVSGSYEVLGLSVEEAEALARLVLEVAEKSVLPSLVHDAQNLKRQLGADAALKVAHKSHKEANSSHEPSITY